jgi:hypothetical protein
MKHGSIKFVCLVVLAFMTLMSAFGDEVTVDLKSIVLESFNGDTAHEWNDGRRARSYDFSWALSASKFATKVEDNDGNETRYPRSTYVDSWPIALFGYNRQGEVLKSFGIHGRFDRQGYNWIDVYPVQQGDDDETSPFEIPMPGRVRYLDLWVWGANLDHYIEAYVRDFQGIVHIVRLGSINYTGWKNLRVNIPNYIRQAKRIQPALAQLRFVKFRIWTQPTERVGNFYVYLKQFKILTDTFEALFDGDELADPDMILEFWAGSN